MSGRTRLWFTIIVVIAFAAMMITFMPTQKVVFEPLGINRNVSLRQGLDLSGGSQVLLQATNCTGDSLADRMENARKIIESRVNGLGVTEPIVQLAGECRILVELPAVDNPAEAIKLVEQTGRLEFVDAGTDFYNEGAIVRTSGNSSPKVGAASDLTPTVPLSSTAALSSAVASQIPDKVYQSIVTGADLDPASLKVALGGTGGNQPEVTFTLVGAAAQTFGQHTAANVGKYLCIVLDNVVQSCPSIRSAKG